MMRSQSPFKSIDGDLMAFRTAWLRAVALAWSNEEFRRTLVESPKQALEQYFSFTWPWQDPSVLDFRVRAEDEFQWIGDDWVWPIDKEDSLRLYLPLRPNLEPEERALALADYYDVRPSIFGTAGGGGATPRGNALITSASIDLTSNHSSVSIADVMLTNSPVRFGGHNPPAGGFVPSGASFMEFEVVLIAALAKAWDNPSFANLLEMHDATVLPAIRGYTTPWRLVIEVENDSEARWRPPQYSGKELIPSGWENLKAAELTLNLPSRPREVRDHPVALAAYNSTGAEYPFTCCA